MKKLLIFILSFFLIVPIQVVFALNERIDPEVVIMAGKKYDLLTGKLKDDPSFSTTGRIQIFNGIIDNDLWVTDTFHHVLFFGKDNSYIGYSNSQYSTVQNSKYIHQDILGTVIIPAGTRSVAFQVSLGADAPYYQGHSLNYIFALEEHGITLFNLFNNADFLEEELTHLNDQSLEDVFELLTSYSEVQNYTYTVVTDGFKGTPVVDNQNSLIISNNFNITDEDVFYLSLKNYGASATLQSANIYLRKAGLAYGIYNYNINNIQTDKKTEIVATETVNDAHLAFRLLQPLIMQDYFYKDIIFVNKTANGILSVSNDNLDTYYQLYRASKGLTHTLTPNVYELGTQKFYVNDEIIINLTPIFESWVIPSFEEFEQWRTGFSYPSSFTTYEVFNPYILYDFYDVNYTTVKTWFDAWQVVLNDYPIGLSQNSLDLIQPYYFRPAVDTTPTPITEGIDDYLETLSINTPFAKTIMAIAFIVLAVVGLALIRTPKPIYLVVGSALYLVFTLMEWLPIWILVIIGVLTFAILFLSFRKGGGATE